MMSVSQLHEYNTWGTPKEVPWKQRYHLHFRVRDCKSEIGFKIVHKNEEIDYCCIEHYEIERMEM